MYRIIYFLLFGIWPQEKPEPEKPHACEEFTRWTNRSLKARVVCAGDGKPLPEEQQYELSRWWQERRCTICGLMEQRNLVHHVEDEEYDDEDED